MAENDEVVEPADDDRDTGGGNEPASDPPPGDGGTPGGSGGDAAGGQDLPPPDPVTGSHAVTVTADEGEIRRLMRDMPPRRRNRFVNGTLIVHYSSRDVEFAMDGESGLRLLAVLAGTSADVDPIVRTSDALASWVMVDRHDVIAAQWVPAQTIVPRRATVDPAGLVDAI